MRRKGEREKHYFERMEVLYNRIKAAGFSTEEINDVCDYLKDKQMKQLLDMDPRLVLHAEFLRLGSEIDPLRSTNPHLDVDKE